MSKNYKRNYSAPSSSRGQLILYGRHAVLSALQNPQRKIFKLLCTKENADEIKRVAPNQPFNIVERKDIDRLFSNDAVHQGFALYCSELPSYSIEEIIALANKKETCHILILDQVTDPQNIGAIIRSCVAFECLALILQDKNSPSETGAMVKSSAGTIEYLPICRVTNLSRCIERLKEAGFWIVGMDGYAKQNISQVDKSGKIAVIMGSEGKGMRRLVEEACDINVRLPINEKVESLNVATAAAIVLYELNKKP